MKRKVCSLILLATLIAAVTGCNTVRGVGRDLNAAGRAIQRAVTP